LDQNPCEPLTTDLPNDTLITKTGNKTMHNQMNETANYTPLRVCPNAAQAPNLGKFTTHLLQQVCGEFKVLVFYYRVIY
jgi:hypothetical protein